MRLMSGRGRGRVREWKALILGGVIMMRRKVFCSKGVGATYNSLLSPLLLGAGAQLSVGHIAG